MARRPLSWKVVEHVNHKKFSNGGVILVKDDPDSIHVNNSSDLALTTSLNDLKIAALHIDGQLIDVDAPPDIIYVDKDDDIIDDEEVLPYDLADFDDEDVFNVDGDDGIRQRHVDKDLGVSASSNLFALACEPAPTPISVTSCVVNGVRFVVYSHDKRRITQNSSICSPGDDGEMYYGQLEEIIEFSYMSFKTVVFRVKWFDTSNKGRNI
nr:S-adenosyl-L-methionine-dependent methyltransferases superfamily protein [Tanacetum cinerariifolium]